VKTIAYCDRMNPGQKYGYCPPHPMKRMERIQAALEELRYVGNIRIYYDRGYRKPLELILERMN
jgi:hypothetical protein